MRAAGGATDQGSAQGGPEGPRGSLRVIFPLWIATLLAGSGCAHTPIGVDGSWTYPVNEALPDRRQGSLIEGDRIDRTGFPSRDGWTSIGDEHWAVTTLWVPGLIVRADKDEFESGSGLEFDADLDSGEGNAIHLQYFQGDGRAIGFTYLTTEHTERDTNSHARTHSGTIDFSVNAALEVDGPFVPFVEAGGGVGVAGIDFNGPIDDSFGAAGAARAHVGVRLFDAIEVIVGGGVFLWGYPGETIGRGAYWSVGATVRF